MASRYDWRTDPAFERYKGTPLTAAQALARKSELHNFNYATFFANRDQAVFDAGSGADTDAGATVSHSPPLHTNE